MTPTLVLIWVTSTCNLPHNRNSNYLVWRSALLWNAEWHQQITSISMITYATLKYNAELFWYISVPLSQWGLKNGWIWADDIFKCIILIKQFVFWFKFHCSLVLCFNWQEVIIGSGNGLVPDGTKPLPEPMLPNMRHTCFDMNLTADNLGPLLLKWFNFNPRFQHFFWNEIQAPWNRYLVYHKVFFCDEMTYHTPNYNIHHWKCGSLDQ